MPRSAELGSRGRVLAPAARALGAVGLVIGLSAALTGVAAGSVRPLHHHPGLGGRPAAAGTVTAPPAGASFSITTHSGTSLTVEVTGSTTYAERGVTSPTLADVTLGELVAVFGTLSGTTVTASEVVIWVAKTSGFRPAAAGTVTVPPAGASFSITTHSGTSLTVEVTTSTTYAERGVTSPTLADVTQGELVAVFGTLSGTTVTASEVVIVPPRPNHGFATAGTVQATPTSTSTDFTVMTWNGTTMTVDVTAATTYAEFGVSAPSLANVTQGEFVGVFGTTSGTTVAATEVVIVGSSAQGLFGSGGRFRGGRNFGGFGFGFGRGSGGFGPSSGDHGHGGHRHHG